MSHLGKAERAESSDFPAMLPLQRKGGAPRRILLAVIVLGLLLMASAYVVLIYTTGEFDPAKARLENSGNAAHEAVGCASENQLYRYYQEGEKNSDLAAMLATGGGCRVIAKGAPFTLVENGFFVSRLLVSTSGGQMPLWVTNASIR